MIVLHAKPEAPATTMATMLVLAQRQQQTHGDAGTLHSVRLFTPEPHRTRVDLGPAWKMPATPHVLAVLSEFGDVTIE